MFVSDFELFVDVEVVVAVDVENDELLFFVSLVTIDVECDLLVDSEYVVDDDSPSIFDVVVELDLFVDLSSDIECVLLVDSEYVADLVDDSPFTSDSE